ncbi:MAG: M28 family peptidase [bacterium]
MRILVFLLLLAGAARAEMLVAVREVRPGDEVAVLRAVEGAVLCRAAEAPAGAVVLDPVFRPGRYFLVPHTRLNPPGAPGAVLWDDARQAVVRLSEDEARAAQDAGWLLAALPRRGFAPAAQPPARLDFAPDSMVGRLTALVSLDTLMADIRRLQDFGTRYSYAPECEAAGRWLADEFRGLGWEVALDTYYIQSTRCINVEATRPGLEPDSAIVIACAHYDSYTPQGMTSAPGADDNATGTAILLELARVLNEYRFQRTVKLLAFSGEEQWMKGSYHWVDSVAVPQGLAIEVAFNVDMVGYVGEDVNDVVINTDVASRPFAVLAESVNNWYDINLSLLNYLDPDCYGDNTPFWEAGYRSTFALEDSEWGIWNGSNPHYHTTHDTVGILTPAVVHGVGRLTAASVATVAVPVEPTALAEPPARPDYLPAGGTLVFSREFVLPGRWDAFSAAGRRVASGAAEDLGPALAPGVYYLRPGDGAGPARRVLKLH